MHYTNIVFKFHSNSEFLFSTDSQKREAKTSKRPGAAGIPRPVETNFEVERRRA